ncbi:hypothetical protein M3936_15175 [Sutcliffiella horikoshii]|uniref:hypothetical protein n=1 Tax=Sutcliffiella horikoshii TaxID=79883 RepID=UPI0020416803|nr:hypothetical protein [Sutcliffiella horikoshii]MCM3618928.1 hypothetical protein [Sutcliffiella horikoshii]
MVKDSLEVFIAKAKNKLHVMEILPYYSLRCCLIAYGEKTIFSLCKSDLQVEVEENMVDIVIEGSTEEIIQLLNGTKMREIKGLSFKGSFRHYLLLDSIFTLVNHSERKVVS